MKVTILKDWNELHVGALESLLEKNYKSRLDK